MERDPRIGERLAHWVRLPDADLAAELNALGEEFGRRHLQDARRLFARGGIQSVHLNGSVVTVTLSSNSTDGIVEIIQNLYTYYVPGVLPPTDEELLADSPA